MRRETRNVTVEVDVDVDLCTLSPNEVEDFEESAKAILRVCNLVPDEPLDRKAIKIHAERILGVLEERR